MSGFGLCHAKVQTRDPRNRRHMSCETSYLVRVGVGKSGGSHKANSSLHAITKVPRILVNWTVLMMCTTENTRCSVGESDSSGHPARRVCSSPSV